MTFGKRLMYACCGVYPGLLLYVLFALASGNVPIPRDHLLPACLFGFVLGMLFPQIMRGLFVHMSHRYFNPDAHEESDEQTLQVLAIVTIVVVVFIAAS